MKKIITKIIVFLCVSFNIHAQNFNTIINTLSDQIATVKTAKKEYIQKIEEVQPGVVKITIEELNLKGKSITTEYEFNTGDIDINTVKTITKKDLIYVQLLVSKKQKLIKKIINKEKISYIEKAVINTQNIDNGREIEETFKKTIPLAKNITTKRLSLTTYQEHIDWLVDNIIDVNLIKKQFTQSLTINNNYPGSIVYNSNVNSGKTNKDYSYHFNLFTINPNSILFKADGEVFSVELAEVN